MATALFRRLLRIKRENLGRYFDLFIYCELQVEARSDNSDSPLPHRVPPPKESVLGLENRRLKRAYRF
jgi:hypothetical protein